MWITARYQVHKWIDYSSQNQQIKLDRLQRKLLMRIIVADVADR